MCAQYTTVAEIHRDQQFTLALERAKEAQALAKRRIAENTGRLLSLEGKKTSIPETIQRYRSMVRRLITRLRTVPLLIERAERDLRYWRREEEQQKETVAAFSEYFRERDVLERLEAKVERAEV